MARQRLSVIMDYFLRLMHSSQITTRLILRQSTTEGEIEILRKFAREISTTASGSLLCLDCTACDASHHNYIELQVLIPAPDGQPTGKACVRLPHYMVLMIVEPVPESGPIGFDSLCH